MTSHKMTDQQVCRSNWVGRFTAGAFIAACSALPAAAETPTNLNAGVNFFINADVTGGVPATIAVGDTTAISDAVEYPGFAFGTYDVDATTTDLTMTLATDPTKLQVGTYDDATSDLYYFEFDRPVSSAVISAVADGFNATVEVLSPGTTLTADKSFVDGLATSFMFANGGILVTIGSGSALRTVGQGGALTVDLTFD